MQFNHNKLLVIISSCSLLITSFADGVSQYIDTFRILWLIPPFYMGVCWLFYKREYNFKTILVLFFLALLFCHCVYFSLNYNLQLGVASFISWGVWIPSFLYLSGQNDKSLDSSLLIMICIIGLIVSFSVILEHTTGNIITKTTTVVIGLHRYYGISQSIVVAANQISISGLILLYSMLQSSRINYKLLYSILYALSFYSLLLTNSRAAIVIHCICFFLIIKVDHKMVSLRISSIVKLGILSIVITFVLSKFIFDKNVTEFLLQAFDMSTQSNLTRTNRIYSSFMLIINNPQSILIGAGAGATVIIPRLLQQIEITTESSFVKILYECGMLGIVVYYVIPLQLIYKSYMGTLRLLNTVNKYNGVISVCLIALITQSLLHDYFGAWCISFTFWILVSIIYKHKYLYNTTIKMNGGRV